MSVSRPHYCPCDCCGAGVGHHETDFGLVCERCAEEMSSDLWELGYFR